MTQQVRLTQKVTELLDDGSVALSPTVPYGAMTMDDDLNDSTPNYYGFVRSDGAWYIMRETKVLTVTTFDYFRGTSGFSTGWTNRPSHTYVTFDSAF